MKHEKSCGAVIIHDKRALLVYQNNGFWGFPKGHIEPDETEYQTALREVKEETGLNITIDPTSRHSFSYYIKDLNIDKEVVLFLAKLDCPADANRIIKQDSEISQIRWVPFAKVNSLLTFPEWQSAWHHIYTKLQQNHQV